MQVFCMCVCLRLTCTCATFVCPSVLNVWCCRVDRRWVWYSEADERVDARPPVYTCFIQSCHHLQQQIIPEPRPQQRRRPPDLIKSEMREAAIVFYVAIKHTQTPAHTDTRTHTSVLFPSCVMLEPLPLRSPPKAQQHEHSHQIITFINGQMAF